MTLLRPPIVGPRQVPIGTSQRAASSRDVHGVCINAFFQVGYSCLLHRQVVHKELGMETADGLQRKANVILFTAMSRHKDLAKLSVIAAKGLGFDRWSL